MTFINGMKYFPVALTAYRVYGWVMYVKFHTPMEFNWGNLKYVVWFSGHFRKREVHICMRSHVFGYVPKNRDFRFVSIVYSSEN